ncbi:rhodanese-like domain-containing protein [Jiulongibacter sediminis]|jgi:rhodanese-related sulfurtransferase|uniref:rhodanese-like domain-containing protein n=1 Tax=Jiulongibacter sediminis TaxID=1605367 RepID=UPI0026EB7724|nr:rhodanese-like domain-containing protein [Jiulongibacter sediminis]
MRIIDNKEALQATENGDAVIIDVRERAEFREGHLPQAINLPLSNFSEEAYSLFTDQKVCLICKSQNRAKQVYQKLEKAGIDNTFVMTLGYDYFQSSRESAVKQEVKGWTIDRQFRMTLGVLMFIFLLGYKFVGNNFLIIPVILATGLVITSIIDRCYMRMGIALLPWNKGKKN